MDFAVHLQPERLVIGTSSLLLLTLVVEQESPAALKIQLERLAPVARRMP